MSTPAPSDRVHALRAAAADYADRHAPLQNGVPRRGVAIVACMDARLDLPTLFDLKPGDAHIIRNAGGVVTDDVIRSLVISQRKLQTTSVLLLHHTDCGQLSYSDDELRRELAEDTGQEPSWSPEAFSDVDDDVRRSIERVRTDPYLPHTDDVYGFVFDVDAGTLRSVLT